MLRVDVEKLHKVIMKINPFLTFTLIYKIQPHHPPGSIVEDAVFWRVVQIHLLRKIDGYLHIQSNIIMLGLWRRSLGFHVFKEADCFQPLKDFKKHEMRLLWNSPEVSVAKPNRNK